MRSIELDIKASTMIKGMRHDGNDTLFVKFNNDSVWRYYPVTLIEANELFVDLPLTGSAGKNFHQYIRGKRNDTECKDTENPFIVDEEDDVNDN